LRVPLKQIIVVIAFTGLAVLLYFAPRGYPGVKEKGMPQGGQQQQHSDISADIAAVKQQLGAEKTKKVEIININ
jgi:hypothetical protein